MHALRRPHVGLAMVLLGVISMVVGVSGVGTAGAQVDPEWQPCNGAFQGTPPGSLAKTTSPAGGTPSDPVPITAGTSVQVTITWDTDDWAEDPLDQLHDCVEVDGELRTDLSYREKPVANDGVATHTYTIPSGLAAGTEVCDRARLSGEPAGDNEDTQKSNIVCFVVAAATTTTAAETTTTTAGPTTTTTAGPTTTTTAGPTTTTEAPVVLPTTTVAETTTTTEAPTTTTTVAETTTSTAAVLPTQLEQTTSTEGAAAAATTTSEARVLGARLARTGGGSSGLLTLAGLTLTLGGLAVAFGEREPRRRTI